MGAGSAWVTAIAPDEGAGLFATGTSDGDVTVWEVYQVDTAMSCVEHTARLNAGHATDAHMSDGSKSSGRSLNGGDQSPSPSPELRNLVFSWDEDSDDDDQDDDDDDEDEDVVEDKAVVYDARKLNLSALSFKDQLLKQNRRQSRSDREKKRKKSTTTPIIPESPKTKADLKLSLSSITNNDDRDPDEYSRNHTPFVPDDIRIAFRTRVPGAVTVQLLLSDCLILIVGTSTGTLLLFVKSMSIFLSFRPSFLFYYPLCRVSDKLMESNHIYRIYLRGYLDQPGARGQVPPADRPWWSVEGVNQVSWDFEQLRDRGHRTVLLSVQ